MAEIKKTKASMMARLKHGAIIYRDFVKNVTTVRVVNGKMVLLFPLKIFEELKEKGVIVLKAVCSFHVEYSLPAKRKQREPILRRY